MLYSIKIGDKNTWTDWRLMPKSRPLVNPPEVRYKTVEIPGRSGVLDLTDVISSDRVFGTRKGSWEFIVINPHIEVSGLEDRKDQIKLTERKWIKDLQMNTDDTYGDLWITRYTEIMGHLHGKKLIVSLTDDPDYAYCGRISVNEWRSEEKYSTIVLDYEFQPFKFSSKITDIDAAEKASILMSEGSKL